jgi:hypothetical protein
MVAAVADMTFPAILTTLPQASWFAHDVTRNVGHCMYKRTYVWGTMMVLFNYSTVFRNFPVSVFDSLPTHGRSPLLNYTMPSTSVEPAGNAYHGYLNANIPGSDSRHIF